jgi:hypothetical protein
MKKLLLLALLGIALWQAWKHYPELTHPAPHHEAVIRNHSKESLEKVRLSVGGQTFVRDVLERGEATVFPFRVTNDATFTLLWQTPTQPDDQAWSGGRVPAGPMVQRYTITVEVRGVTYQVEDKPQEESKKGL